MIAAKENFPRFTPEEYFAWEEQQEEKHEYFDGEVYAMSGGTLNHSEIASNFNRLLGNHLEDSDCRVLNSDARVKIQRSEKYVYPDVSVTCDERDRQTTKYIARPCTIVEVLSPGTVRAASAFAEAYDRGKKFKLYRQSASLIDYVLVNADEIEIDVFRQNDRGRWEEINYVAGDLVELESINLTFPIERVYRGINFQSEAIDNINS
jgi:Uma2 family endonuclease